MFLHSQSASFQPQLALQLVSPGALAIYSGDLFPEWKGNFLIAGLSSQALIRLALKDDRVVGEERLLMERKERIREVTQGPEGAVYLLTDGSGAKLLKLTPAARGPEGTR